MKSDVVLKTQIERELCLDAGIDASDIAVTVSNGVVTLSGFVRGYRLRREAERAVKRTDGVCAIANDLEVRLQDARRDPDMDLVFRAATMIRHALPYSAERIRVVANGGLLTLEGELEWNYQQARAEQAVQRLRGVKGVITALRIGQRVTAADVKQSIH